MRERSAPAARTSGRRVNPLASVVGITLVALVGVGVLAVQANGSGPKGTTLTQEPPQPVRTANPSGPSQAPAPNPLALPADSGSGKRIVYSLGKNRIWLVNSDGSVKGTAQTVAGTVRPTVGSYKVTSHESTGQGGDGTSVQYVVIFGHAPNGTSLGFDAVYGLSGMPPAPTGKTGGIRMAQDDALAVWEFTGSDSSGTPVIVVA